MNEENKPPADSPIPPPPPTLRREPKPSAVKEIKQIKRLHFIRLMDFVSELGDCILLEPKPKPTEGFRHVFTGAKKEEKPFKEVQELISFWRCVSGDLLRSSIKVARQKLQDQNDLEEYHYDPSKMQRHEIIAHRQVVTRLLIIHGHLDRCLLCGKHWKVDCGANNEYVKNHLLKGDYNSMAKSAQIAPTGIGNQNVWWNFIPVCCSKNKIKNPTKTDMVEDLESQLNVGLDFYPENLLISLAFWFKIMKRDPYTRTHYLLGEANLKKYKEDLVREKEQCTDKMYKLARAADDLVFCINKWMNTEEPTLKSLLEDTKAFVEKTKKFDGSISDKDIIEEATDKRLSRDDATLIKSIEDLHAKVKESEAVERIEDESPTVKKAREEDILRKSTACIEAIQQINTIKRTMEEIHEALHTIIPNLPTIIKDRQKRVKNIAFSFFTHVVQLLSEIGYTRTNDALDEDSLIYFVIGFFFVNTDPKKVIDPDLPELLDWRFLKMSLKEQAIFRDNIGNGHHVDVSLRQNCDM